MSGEEKDNGDAAPSRLAAPEPRRLERLMQKARTFVRQDFPEMDQVVTGHFRCEDGLWFSGQVNIHGKPLEVKILPHDYHGDHAYVCDAVLLHGDEAIGWGWYYQKGDKQSMEIALKGTNAKNLTLDEGDGGGWELRKDIENPSERRYAIQDVLKDWPGPRNEIVQERSMLPDLEPDI